MDLFLIILSFLFAITAILGSIFPILPGLPFSILALLLANWSGYTSFSTIYLIVWGVIMAIITIADNFIPPLVTKLGGGSKNGVKGSLIGSLLGMFFPPLGIIIGAFLGALALEIIISKTTYKIALRSAFYSFIGFILTVGIKLIISSYILYAIIVAL